MIYNNRKITLALAPMAGQGDAVFRRICRRWGADFATSEMISAKGLFYHDQSTASLAKITADDYPLALQLFGHEPKTMAYAAATLASCEYPGANKDLPPAAIDINMGCPVRKIVNNGDGSALSLDVPLAADVVGAVRAACEPFGIPVTVKIRAGWDAEHINAVELARACEGAGASEITVHGRTRVMFYSGRADMGIIAEVKRAVSIPVIANGDVKSADDAIRALETTGADGLAIARGAVGSPWIFSEINAASGNAVASNLSNVNTREFLCRAAYEHACAAVEESGAHGLFEVRPHLAAYLHGFDGAAAMRSRAVTVRGLDELGELLGIG